MPVIIEPKQKVELPDLVRGMHVDGFLVSDVLTFGPYNGPAAAPRSMVVTFHRIDTKPQPNQLEARHGRQHP
jgi:hypothetical protein